MAVVKRAPCWTVDELIRRGVEIHGDKYDYSLIDPSSKINSKSKVTIKCKTCEYIFDQTVTIHIYNKSGCPACNNRILWNPTRFIEKATEIHGNKYDYSLIDLNSKIRTRTELSIKCNTCGYIFQQSLTSHIHSKNGCSICSRKFAWTPAEFISKATEIHNNKYDYSLIDLNSKIKLTTKVPIKCRTCSYIFMKQVGRHISQIQGCINCAKKVTLDLQKFIVRATQIHGNKYDYSMISPNSKITINTRVKIKCKKCGYIFERRISNHICHKSGCDRCKFLAN